MFSIVQKIDKSYRAIDTINTQDDFINRIVKLTNCNNLLNISYKEFCECNTLVGSHLLCYDNKILYVKKVSNIKPGIFINTYYYTNQILDKYYLVDIKDNIVEQKLLSQFTDDYQLGDKIYITGDRKTGKTTIVKNILKTFSDIPITICSAREDEYASYNVMYRKPHELIKYLDNKDEIIVIEDDTSMNIQQLEQIINFDKTIIIVSQYCSKLSSWARSLFTHVIITSNIVQSYHKKNYEMFFSKSNNILNYDQFQYFSNMYSKKALIYTKKDNTIKWML